MTRDLERTELETGDKEVRAKVYRKIAANEQTVNEDPKNQVNSVTCFV